MRARPPTCLWKRPELLGSSGFSGQILGTSNSSLLMAPSCACDHRQ